MNLETLLTLSARDAAHETRAKWRNAHRARIIRGRYQDGAMLELSTVTHRSLSTLYKWSDAAEFFTLLVQVALAETPYNKTVILNILRRAVAELSPWFFHAAAHTWRYHEDIWALMGDLQAALDGGWEIGQFKDKLNAAYRPETLTPLEQAEKHLTASLELFQRLEGDNESEQLKKLKARFVAHFMNGARAVHCPDCAHEIELERFVKYQQLDE